MSVQVFIQVLYFMFKQHRDIKGTRHKKKRSFCCNVSVLFVDSFIIRQQRVAGVFGRYVLSNIKIQGFRYNIQGC
jgi:hypothetical protein